MDFLKLSSFDVKIPDQNDPEFNLFQDIKSGILTIFDQIIQENKKIPYEFEFTAHIIKEKQNYELIPYGNIQIFNSSKIGSSPQNKVIFLNDENDNIIKIQTIKQDKFIYSTQIIVHGNTAFFTYWKHKEYINHTLFYYILPLNKSDEKIKDFQFFHSYIKEFTHETEIQEFLRRDKIFTKIGKTLKNNETRLVYMPKEEKNNIANIHQVFDYNYLMKNANLTKEEEKNINHFCHHLYEDPKFYCVFLRKYENNLLLTRNKLFKKTNNQQRYELWSTESIIAHKKI